MRKDDDDDYEAEASPPPSSDEEMDRFAASESPVASTSKATPASKAFTTGGKGVVRKVHPKSKTHLINGTLQVVQYSGGRPKTHVCEYEDCDKAFTRPSRLKEHVRSHTGERPFKCTFHDCDAVFFREDHLKAHSRVHQSEDTKSSPCDQCDKSFWTNQHLKEHIAVVHNGNGKKTYDCEECEEKYRKHHQLKAHVAEAHREPGADPFSCDFEGCSRTFKQLVHLKNHRKVHEAQRYVCSLESCLDLPMDERDFGTWSALQSHCKSDHPATCPYPECDSKTFTTPRGLRNHLALHEEREAGGEKSKKRMRGRGKKRQTTPPAIYEENPSTGRSKCKAKAAVYEAVDSTTDEEDNMVDDGEMEDDDAPPRKKIAIAVPVNGVWSCPEAECERLFQNGNALERHRSIAHLDPLAQASQDRRTLSRTSTARSSPVRGLPTPTPTAASSKAASPSVVAILAKKRTTSSSQLNRNHRPSVVDLLTGHNYIPVDSTEPGARRFACPFPNGMRAIDASLLEKNGAEAVEEEEVEEEGCEYRFMRVYDVVRHLKASHALTIDQNQLNDWYEEREGDESDPAFQSSEED